MYFKRALAVEPKVTATRITKKAFNIYKKFIFKNLLLSLIAIENK